MDQHQIATPSPVDAFLATHPQFAVGQVYRVPTQSRLSATGYIDAEIVKVFISNDGTQICAMVQYPAGRGTRRLRVVLGQLRNRPSSQIIPREGALIAQEVSDETV